MAISAAENTAKLLGLHLGMVVQELGWDVDVDEELRQHIMDAIDADLVEESLEAVDLVLLWQRDDTDVVDSFVDALTDLASTGYIWLMTPKIGRSGHVSSAEIAEGAKAAGLALTSSVKVSEDWTACKVVRPKSERNR